MRILLVSAFCALLTIPATAADVGKPSPAFTIQRIGSTPVQLSQYRGKVVALAIMMTTCPHCQNLAGLLSTINKEYEGKGVQIVGCAFNDGAQGLIPGFIEQTKANFPVGYCPRDAVLSYLNYSVLTPFYVPHMVFLDRAGVIRGDFPGESPFMTDPAKNVRAELDELLKSGTKTASTRPHHTPVKQ